MLTGQTFQDLSFGTDTTLEVMTWNIERFPKNSDITIDYVKEIIDALNIDIIGLQEINSKIAFSNLLFELDNYEGYIGTGTNSGLAFVYNPEVISVNSIYEIYTSTEYWRPFPRPPVVLDINYFDERIIIINNHLKCCGDEVLDTTDVDDEETRRYHAINLLKQYTDMHFSDAKTIVIGDLNDNLRDEAAHNVFRHYLQDTSNYYFTDYHVELESPSGWSYPTWPSHLDHILISDELFDAFRLAESTLQVFQIEDLMIGGWKTYDENISDHRPVAAKFYFNIPGSSSEQIKADLSLNYFPNPFSNQINISVSAENHYSKIEIFDINAQRVFSSDITATDKSLVWDANQLPDGFYFIKVTTNQYSSSKLLPVLKIRK